MKYSLFAVLLFLSSCRMISHKRVDGDGIIKTETRDLRDFSKIEVEGSFDVEIQQSDEYKVTLMADENLLQYIRFRKQDRRLEIREADGFNLHSDKGIRVILQMPRLEAVSIAGSGTVRTLSKFESSDKFHIDIAGGGEAILEIKSPNVTVRIGGSGNANLKGVTKNLDVSIGGSGNCVAPDLLSENCDVSIGGSGSARVFASMSLEASIGGSGNIYYGGHPQNVKKSIGGSGSIEENK